MCLCYLLGICDDILVKDWMRLNRSHRMDENLIIDTYFQEKIAKASHEMRGKELQILDDFCKAYYAAEMHMTGKDLAQIADTVCLNIQHFYKDGQYTTKYWFSPKDE
jgi:hypothetical protein